MACMVQIISDYQKVRFFSFPDSDETYTDLMCFHFFFKHSFGMYKIQL